MPVKKTIAKRIRQAEKSEQYNRHYKSMLKTSIKKVLAAQDKTTAKPLLRAATAVIDKVVTKGVIHRNKGANQKERIQRYFSKLS